MIIKLDNTGKPIPDHLCKRVLLSNQHSEIHVSTNNVIVFLRNLILNGQINHKHVAIIVDGKLLHINEYGNIIGNTSGLKSLNWDSELNLDTLKMQVKIKKNKKNTTD